MTAAEGTPTYRPVVCAPWCEDKSHHRLAIDRACWSPGTNVKLSLSDSSEVDLLGVYAYRQDETAPPAVKLHVYLDERDVDSDPLLTAGEARTLSEALTAAADLIEGNPNAPERV
jgi:hypothetical protein